MTAADAIPHSVSHVVSHTANHTSVAATETTVVSTSPDHTTTNSTMTSGVSVGGGMGVKSFATTTTVAEDSYNDFNFWRLPIRSMENIGGSIDGL